MPLRLLSCELDKLEDGRLLVMLAVRDCSGCAEFELDDDETDSGIESADMSMRSALLSELFLLGAEARGTDSTGAAVAPPTWNQPVCFQLGSGTTSLASIFANPLSTSFRSFARNRLSMGSTPEARLFACDDITELLKDNQRYQCRSELQSLVVHSHHESCG